MAMIEVVAAIVDGNRLSTNLPEIDAIRLLGGRIEYISRHEAVDLADRCDDSLKLADAPTLLILDDGVVYRPRHQSPQKPAAAKIPQSSTMPKVIGLPHEFQTAESDSFRAC